MGRPRALADGLPILLGGAALDLRGVTKWLADRRHIDRGRPLVPACRPEGHSPRIRKQCAAWSLASRCSRTPKRRSKRRRDGPRDESVTAVISIHPSGLVEMAMAG